MVTGADSVVKVAVLVADAAKAAAVLVVHVVNAAANVAEIAGEIVVGIGAETAAAIVANVASMGHLKSTSTS